LRRELDELFAGRAFWLLLLIVGLLVGQSFITAVNAYAEASGIGGGVAALAQGLSPLDGFVTPVLGAYDLAITLLFPFVAIRLVASEKSSGALKLMLQWPVTMRAQLASKLVALLVAWLIALIPFAIAAGLWLAYGGHLDAGETLNVVAGYTLRFVLTSALAVAAAAMMPGAANAAVLVLGITIGTWALDFLAAGRGGFVQKLATFTPTATLRAFERGLFRVDVVLILLLLSLCFFALAGIALQLGRAVRERVLRDAIAVAIALVAIALAAQVHTSYDLSENRRNSFGAADARMLAAIGKPLEVTVFLAAEDPRMSDFENNVLVKLRRAMRVEVHYPFGGSSALFENDPRYGEIHYRLGGKTAISRSTTEEIVLETISSLWSGGLQPAGVAPGIRRAEARRSTGDEYPGYPLAKRPASAALIFYVLWPLGVLTAWLLRSRRTG